MERHIFSVTEVNELVKLLLDQEPMLSGICVRGEIAAAINEVVAEIER